MVTTRRMRLALLAGAIFLALGGWFAATKLAQSDVSSLGIGSATVEPGGEVTLSVTAQATAPGIGAYTVDVVYDSAIVHATACTMAGGTCSIDLIGPETVRLVGWPLGGPPGTVNLGSITFQAGQQEGTVNLDVQVVDLFDPDGADIRVTPTDGIITIVASAPTAVTQGNIDCDSGVDSGDAMKIAQWIAGLVPAQESGCPAIGGPITGP